MWKDKYRQFIDRYRDVVPKERDNGDVVTKSINDLVHRKSCPECGEPLQQSYFRMCTLNQAMYRYIPAGEHIHIQCPVHGSHRIDGFNGDDRYRLMVNFNG